VKTQDVHIYSNLIYMNEQEGIYVASKADDVKRGADAGTVTGWVFQVADVYVYNNIIAHNLGRGVRIDNNDGTRKDVTGVALFGNLIIRNARGMLTDDDHKSYTVQVSWEGQMYVDRSSPGRFLHLPNGRSDYNCYLAWDPTATGYADWSKVRQTSDGLMCAIRVGQPDSRWYTASEAGSILGMEENGTQVADLAELRLLFSSLLVELEGYNGIELPVKVGDANMTGTLAHLGYVVMGDVCRPLDPWTTYKILHSLGVSST
jgi:hypothetical protein